jgi:hypothetical protein
MVFVAVIAVQLNTFYHQGVTTATTSRSTTSYVPIHVTGMPITPPLSLPEAPPITTQQPVGSRLTNINMPLNTSELAVINNASQSYFVTAAEMYLNHNSTLTVPIGAIVSAAPLLIVNGKPSVTYLGAISCIYCGENRWAMALALSRFGEFQQLFKGYSALGDGDVPTIYWGPAYYNGTKDVQFGTFYTSSYINFISIEGKSRMTGGFVPPLLANVQQEAIATANPAYANATKIIAGLNNYAGTPYTIWGKFSVPGADASDFGDSTFNSNTSIPIASLTHEQLLSRLAHPSSPFAWNEYAAADFYVSLMCASMSSPAPVCSLPSISAMVSQVSRA